MREGLYDSLLTARLRAEEEILEQLVENREGRGLSRNLVVAATGTGKTMLAGFDYARQDEVRGPLSSSWPIARSFSSRHAPASVTSSATAASATC